MLTSEPSDSSMTIFHLAVTWIIFQSQVVSVLRHSLAKLVTWLRNMRNLRAKNIYIYIQRKREGETRQTPQSASHHVFQKSLTQIAKSFDAHAHRYRQRQRGAQMVCAQLFSTWLIISDKILFFFSCSTLRIANFHTNKSAQIIQETRLIAQADMHVATQTIRTIYLYIVCLPMCALYNVYAPISTRLWKFSANKVFYFPPSPLPPFTLIFLWFVSFLWLLLLLLL